MVYKAAVAFRCLVRCIDAVKNDEINNYIIKMIIISFREVCQSLRCLTGHYKATNRSPEAPRNKPVQPVYLPRSPGASLNKHISHVQVQ